MNLSTFNLPKGCRITKQRQKIFTLISGQPQSTDEIFKRIKNSKYPIDKVTVYRTLSFFVKCGLVLKTRFKDTSTRYELAKNNHHHHIICNNCGKIQDIYLDEKHLVNRVKNQTDYLIKEHSLEFFGLCKACQNKMHSKL